MGFFSRKRSDGKLEQQVVRPSREAQVTLGREAHARYLTMVRNPLRPTEFDRLVLNVFDGIESCSDDIDERIETLRRHWNREWLLQQWWDRTKLGFVVDVFSPRLFWKRTPEATQLRENLHRLYLITWFGSWNVDNVKIAKSWVDPAPELGTTAL